MKLNSKSGFSLVELMVVVAIIGILATIAVPNFQKFQARARQSSAKTELTGVYTAQKGFSAEYAIYHSHLPLIGYVPEGINIAANYPVIDQGRVYSVGAGANNVPCAIGAAGSACEQLPPAPGGFAYPGFYAAGARGCTQPASRAIAVLNQGAVAGAQAARFIGNGAQPTTSLLGGAGGTAAFVAKAVGCPRASSQTAAQADVWAINDMRELINARSGI